MKSFEFFILVFFTSMCELFSQTENVKLNKADEYLSHCYFSSALPLYQDLLKLDSSDAIVNFKIGVCYFSSRSQKNKAAYYLEKAISSFNYNATKDKNILQNISVENFNILSNQESSKTNLINQERSLLILAYKNLGDAYHLAYKFDSAVECYEKLRSRVQDSSIEELLNKKIAMCRFGKTLKNLVSFPLKLENVSSKRNYISSSISGLPSLLFKSYQIEWNFNNDFDFFEALNVCSETASLQIFSTDFQHEPLSDTVDDSVLAYTGIETSVGTSVDGQFVLIFKVENGKGNLYTTCLTENQWTLPEELNKTVNTKGWEEDEFISADGYSLYFSSKRDGGYGGKDIYKCKKLENGKWSKASNLGPSVNTPFDDETPFIFPDEDILYFSSNRNRVNGHFDIFSSSQSNNGAWSRPIRVGYPVLKTVDHLQLKAIHNEKENGNENQLMSGIKKDESDERNNFLITFYNDKKASITLLKGKVVNLFGKCIKDLKITVTDIDTDEVLGVYYPNSIKGNYSIILPTGKNSNISYEADGYLFHSEHIDIAKETNYYNIHNSIIMSPIAKGAKTELSNVFFDPGKSTISSISNTELNKLYNFLTNNPNLVIEIAACIDTNKNVRFNKELGLLRVHAVINYLIQKGISSERIRGKVYMKRKSNATIKNNHTNENFDGEQLNHRLEMVILKINE